MYRSRAMYPQPGSGTLIHNQSLSNEHNNFLSKKLPPRGIAIIDLFFNLQPNNSSSQRKSIVTTRMLLFNSETIVCREGSWFFNSSTARELCRCIFELSDFKWVTGAPAIHVHFLDKIQRICYVSGSNLAYRLQSFYHCRNVAFRCFFYKHFRSLADINV